MIDFFRVRPGLEVALHLVEELELVGELHVLLRVGDVAAGRHVEILQVEIARQDDAAVAGVALVAPVLRILGEERQARQDGDAVIALHAVAQDVGIAQRLQRLLGELAVLHLDLLQADDVRLLLLDQAAQ
jgi:hypothetical protein